MGKYYAVKVGRKPGIYNTWAECKAQVDGFSGAVYKSFLTYEEAENFISKNVRKPSSSKVELKAYVDGSYDNSKKYYSYACVLFHGEKRIEIAAADNDPKIVNQRNVAGEVNAVINVVKFALENKVRSLEIYYDYAGIEKWAIKEWQAKNDFTKGYVEFMSKHSSSIDIRFVKVKSHSGDEYNDLVDALAKEALLDVEKPIKRIIDMSNSKIVERNEQKEEKNYEEILGFLKPTKKSVNLGLMYKNKVISNDDIYEKLKKYWKNKSNKITDIFEIKSVYDVENDQLIFIVTTKNKDNHIVRFKKEEWE